MKKRDFLEEHEFEQVIDKITLVVASVLIASALFVGIMELSRARCASIADELGFEHRYSYAASCEVETHLGRWIPLRDYYDGHR